MKKYILTILMAVVAILSVSAQQKLVIKLENGEQITKEIWEVDSLYFIPSETVTSDAPAEPVDLGFAKWAPYNLGATTQSETGWLVGWGDVTGTNKSTKLKYFPAQVYSNDIYETGYDIAHTMWSGEWRLPVVEEIQALKDKCTWEATVVDEVPGYKITSKENGNSIFLPFAGYRNGNNAPTNANNMGLYWTGNIGENIAKAKALFINETDSEVVERDRFLGLAIRPIYGKFVHPLKLTVDEPYDVTISSVTIPAELTGDATAMAKVSIVGFCFGKANETVNPSDPNVDPSKKIERAYESGNTQISLNISDLQPNTSYKAVMYLLLDDATMIPMSSDTIRFTTLAKFPVPTSGVRLGSMDIEWAEWNMGESTEWGNTHLYGWGDADGENTSTDYNSYAVGLSTNATSICGNVKYDIAAKQWGDGWRLPTMAEMRALYNSSDITITKQYNGSEVGYRFTDKNTNASILIPACGVRYGDTNRMPGTYYYWTGEASYSSQEGWGAYVAYLQLNTMAEELYHKYWGMAIRPVRTIGSGNNSGSSTTGTDSRAIDLGLSDGTLWADRNLGASSATDYGDYFAWGEIEPRTTNFDEAHYQYYDSSVQAYQKIGTDVNDINGEWLICGDEQYDAAAYLWKGKWRMPTDSQIRCLVNECTWVWKTNYMSSGHSGYLVTGTNGNSIFLPASGKIGSNELIQDGVEAYYWSGALNTLRDDNMTAFAINIINNGQYYRVFNSRVIGCSIRPVMRN